MCLTEMAFRLQLFCAYHAEVWVISASGKSLWQEATYDPPMKWVCESNFTKSNSAGTKVTSGLTNVALQLITLTFSENTNISVQIYLKSFVWLIVIY